MKSLQASWGRCRNGWCAIIAFTSPRIIKMIFKDHHSRLEKASHYRRPTAQRKNAPRAAVAIRALCVWAAPLAEDLGCLTLFFIRGLYTYFGTNSAGLEKEWGERKHFLSTWPSEPSTQSSSSSPCINPQPDLLCTTALRLIRVVIRLPLKVLAVPSEAVLKMRKAASALRSHVGFCLNVARWCFAHSKGVITFVISFSSE